MFVETMIHFFPGFLDE